MVLICLLLPVLPCCSYVIAITVAPIIQSLVENQMQFMLNVVGLKMRNGLMAAIYRKCLRLSNAALQSESTGRVVTLMSNDAQKVGVKHLGCSGVSVQLQGTVVAKDPCV